MDRKMFFATVRATVFGGKLTQSQVDGLTRILDEADRREIRDRRWIADMLGQVYWETAHTMQPIREMGGEKYLKSKDYYPWVGEGLIQVTWEANARKFGAKKPGDLMTWPTALVALFDGMTKGMFTKRKLSDYFDADTTDWIGARKIVNGTDHAAAIAAICKEFYLALCYADDAALYAA